VSRGNATAWTCLLLFVLTVAASFTRGEPHAPVVSPVHILWLFSLLPTLGVAGYRAAHAGDIGWAIASFVFWPAAIYYVLVRSRPVEF
jgi:hypothetical protein